MSKNDQSIIKSNTYLNLLSEAGISIPNKIADLLYFSLEDEYNIETRSGLFVSIVLDSNGISTKSESSNEPSTIFLRLPIKKPSNPSAVPPPGYYPSYRTLSPEQRWIYIDWLRSTTKPINIGYVFIYYYGLEKKLFTEKFDLAIEEIITLRQNHDNPSFENYSNDALQYACIFNNRPDKFEYILKNLEIKNINNLRLLMIHHLGYELTAPNLIELTQYIRSINKRYISREPETYTQVIDELLEDQFGGKYFPFSSRYSLDSLPKDQKIIFANTSFSSDVRTPEIPNFFSYSPFVDAVSKLHKEAHERVKVILRERRKKK